MSAPTQHRPEIDGLRAVAVLPVILFHAHVPGLEAGFIGVDVFFVISGFLITGIIKAELDQDGFSFLKFYERRARRILPALFTVAAACFPFAWLWMLPAQLTDFAKSLVAVSLFASNFLFWSEAGYFEATADEKPLLHTWSLSVEEQFYLLFPLLLVATFRTRPTAVRAAVVAACIASFFLSEFASRTSPSANFYWLPMRAWELLIGSICALSPRKTTDRFDDTLAAAGLLCLCVALVVIGPEHRFPSALALLPTLGTALVLRYAVRGTMVASLLSARPLVLVGLISYSAYLWHQPLFAFAQIRLLDPATGVLLLLGAASLLLAYVTWRFVEQPFRRVQGAPGRFLAASTIGGVVLFGAVGALVICSEGAPQRVALESHILEDIEERTLEDECFNLHKRAPAPAGFGTCALGPPNASRNAVVIGDSHSLSYLPSLSSTLGKYGFSTTYAGISACPPLHATRTTRLGADACAARNRTAFEAEHLAGVDVVVLIARWTYYSTGDITGKLVPLISDYGQEASDATLHELFLSSLRGTVRHLKRQGVPIVLVHQPPLQRYTASQAYSFVSLFGDATTATLKDLSLTRPEYADAYGGLRSDIDAIVLSSASANRTVDPTSTLCAETCLIGDLEHSNYLDDDHLSNFGASRMADVIVRAVLQTME